MGTNKGTIGKTDSSNDDPSGHSPEFGKVSGSAGASGSQPASSVDDPMRPSPRRSSVPESSVSDENVDDGAGDDMEGTDASGNRRSDSVSGIIDSGKKSPSRGDSSSQGPL